MLGNHVNVSARKKTILQKVLCVFLAFVLLGLMVPHGIASQLNAYAQNTDAEQTQNADDQGITENQPTQSEEVIPQDPTPAAAPVVNGDSDSNEVQISVSNAGNAYFGKGLTPPPKVQFNDETSEGSGLYKSLTYLVEDGETDLTYAGLLADLKEMVELDSNIIVSLPIGVQYSDFAYTNIDESELNSKILELGKQGHLELVCKTSVTFSDAAANHGKLLKDNVESSWGEVSNLKYGAGYTYDHVTHEITLDDLDGTTYTYTVEAITGVWTGFSGAEAGGKVLEGTVFTATYLDNIDVHFSKGIASDEIKFYKWDDATAKYVVTDISQAVSASVDGKFNLAAPKADGYEGALELDGVNYAFQVITPSSPDNNYKWSKWSYSTDGQEWTEVTEEETIGLNAYFKADFDIRVSFIVDPQPGTNIGKVVDSGGNIVTLKYYPVGTVITKPTSTTIKFGEDTFTAEVIDTDHYAFTSFSNVTSPLATPVTVIAQFNKKPVVKLDTDDRDHMSVYVDGVIVQKADLPKSFNYPVGTTYALSQTKETLTFTFPNGITTAYTASGDGHYAKFSEWQIDGESITSQGTLEVDKEYSVMAVSEKLDNLEISGSMTDGAYYRYEILVEDVTVKEGTGTSAGTYKITDLPVGCTVNIYAECSGYIAAQKTVSVETESKSGQDVTLEAGYSYIYGGVSDGVWNDDNTDGKKPFKVEQGGFNELSEYYITSTSAETKITMKAKVGDVITFASLKTNTAAVNKTVSFGGGIPLSWNRYLNHQIVSRELTSTEGNEGILTVTFSKGADIDFIGIKTVDRTVTFKATQAQGSVATGWFSDGSSPVTSLNVAGMGAKYKLASETETSKVTFDSSGTTTNIQAIASSTQGTESIFREWVDVTTTDVDIINDVTLNARFVQENVKLIFDKGTSPVEAEGTAQTTIKMDSVFSQTRTDSSHANAVFTLAGVADTHTINISTTDKVKYKFAETVFSGVGQGKEKIDENNYSTIEKDGLKLTYSIIVKSKISVTIDLDGGHFVNYTIPEVPSDIGGIGAWDNTAQADKYTNSFYEEYPIATIASTYLTKNKKQIDKDSGFFKGEWDGPTSGDLTAATSWKALYEAAGWITADVTGKKTATTTEKVNDALVELWSDAVLDPEGHTTLEKRSGSDGIAKFKVYDKSVADIRSGANGYMQSDDQHIAEADWNQGAVTKAFTLELGYTWVVYRDTAKPNYWESKYNPGAQLLFEEGTSSVSGNVVNFDSDMRLHLKLGDPIRYDSGDEVIFKTSNTTGNLNFKVEFYLEDKNIENNSVTYTLWKHSVLYTSHNEGNWSVERIDYRIPYEDYISIYGECLERNAQGGIDHPVKGISINFEAENHSNEEVVETESIEGGLYYLILKKGSKGTVMFRDNRAIREDDDHLDERIILDGTEEDDLADVEATMIPAIHVSGTVMAEDFYTHEVKPAQNVTISYANFEGDPVGEKGWRDDDITHGFTYTDENGNYSYKIKKDAEKFGGYIYFNLAGYAQDGHMLKKDGQELSHGEDIDGISSVEPLSALGAKVDIHGGEGHDTFEVYYYQGDKAIDHYFAKDSTGMQFAASSRLFATYDEHGNNILRYDYYPYGVTEPTFTITLRPIASDGYTYWAWRCTDAISKKTSTLLDNTEIFLEPQTDDPYVFNVDYTEGATVTIGGAGAVGHAGFNLDVLTKSGTEEYRYPTSVIGADDYTFTFPVSNNQENVDEIIEASYDFNGTSYNLNLSTDFTTADGDTVHYVEQRAFTPIPAEGYMLTGFAVNGQDLTPGAKVEMESGTGELNVVAKYALIPNVAQTGDAGNYWWLIALAVVAMAGVGFAASRKQKGIRC